ncbi:MAG: TRAP transporter permease, partial [Eubacteriales bacterium]
MGLFKKKAVNDIPDNVEDVLKKFDRESNVRIWTGKPKAAVGLFMAAFSAFCIWVTLYATFAEEIRLTSFVALIIVMGYLTYPVKKGQQKENYMPWYDWVIMALGAGAFLYYTFNATDIIMLASKITTFHVILGIIGVLALAELCRRCVGLPILIVAGLFVAYALFIGLTNPDFMKRISSLIYTLFYTKQGILGTPISVCSKYIVVFIIFGAFLERTGISAFFIDLANCAAGKYAGGPAKVAVLSSALCGMVSGSSVGNTVTTGSITIPMMKESGYKSEFSGAVEAAASTGGQIMPPIMGAAAFLMIDYLGVPYSYILVRAILPALLYFAGIFIMVHMEAKKLGLQGIPKELLPKFGKMISKIFLLIPLIVLVVLASSNYTSIQFAASIAIVLAIVVSMFNKGNRITPRGMLDALEAGARSTISVAVACGLAGIVAGVTTATGLANILITAVVTAANGQLLIALFLTMICCIILGMGLPTTATYCIMAATCAPMLEQMGVDRFAAHMFVFYFGIVADITPPVALAAYAGSAIAKSEPMKTAFTASKLAIGAFVVPFVFCMAPELLFIGDNVTLMGS